MNQIGDVFAPLNDHISCLGTVYILKAPSPISEMVVKKSMTRVYGPGVGWPEDRNTLHWLENRGTIPAVEISVDIVTIS